MIIPLHKRAFVLILTLSLPALRLSLPSRLPLCLPPFAFLPASLPLRALDGRKKQRLVQVCKRIFSRPVVDPLIPSLIILGQCPLVSELSKSRTLTAGVQEGEGRRVVRKVRVSGACVNQCDAPER